MDEKQFDNISSFEAWILATRPKTLPAALAPVVVGSALALAHGRFAPLPALAALTVALLLQIGVNLANDYFDYIKGIDSEERLGPVRVTQSGLIAPEQVKAATGIVLGMSALPALYLVNIGGWPVIVIGVASVLAALAYSGGPFPLASNGLGDLFVFIFFGLVAVGGTYYVQALQLTALVLVMGGVVGLLITAILVVNNLRDIPTDRKTGKRTLAVRMGRHATVLEYALMWAISYLTLPILWFSGAFSAWVLLPFATAPFVWRLVRAIFKTSEGPMLNQALATTAKLAFVFSLLLGVGIVV